MGWRDDQGAALLLSCVLNVPNWRHGGSQCCSHLALKGLTVRGVVVAMQSSNVTCQDIFYSAPVEWGETGGVSLFFLM